LYPYYLRCVGTVMGLKRIEERRRNVFLCTVVMMWFGSEV
jgi:hypothetical protein